MNRLLICLLLLFSFSVNTFSQGVVIQNAGTPEERAYADKTVVFRLKESYRRVLETFSTRLPAFNLKDFDAEKINRIFPQIKNNRVITRSDGSRIDLSLIYTVSYKGRISVPEAVKLLKKTGLFEYVEPLYLPKPLYVPDDPYAQPGSNQFYLDRIKAYEAWDIEKGDTNVVIGIIDNGSEITHTDLTKNLHRNYDDPVNGTDDDGDGFIDNYTGWDFADQDNDVKPTGPHGTVVTGCAAATTDNGKGVAGTGFNCRYMPLKAAPDDRPGTITGAGYQAIQYAAENGCDIINLSWGSNSSYNQAVQDLIDYVVLVHDVVVVAAAGNDKGEYDFYPASYDKVLSVAACDTVTSPSFGGQVDKKADFATYSYNVDLCAQGKTVYSTTTGNSYKYDLGSSFATPIVTGAAALLRSKHPDLNALQVMEQLRATGDIVDTFPETKEFQGKYGRRLNMYKALVDTLTPGVRMTRKEFKSQVGPNALNGDTVDLVMELVNYLHPTTNLNISVTPVNSEYIEMLDSISMVGVVNTMDTAYTDNDPIRFRVIPNSSLDNYVAFRVDFEDGDYKDYQYFKLLINRSSWITVDTNDITYSVTGSSRIGYADPSTSEGDGFSYNGQSLLYEAGLMVATSPTKVSDAVRDESLNYDKDFKAVSPVQVVDSDKADVVTSSRYTDSAVTATAGVTVEENTYTWDEPGFENFTIFEYKITNESGNHIDSAFAGIFADWDIEDAMMNKGDWSPDEKLGYIYSTSDQGLYAGVSLLTEHAPSYFVLDHSQAGNNNINPNDGYPSAEKWATLANGIIRPQGGEGSSEGNDVSHVLSGKLKELEPGETQTIAFALIGAASLQDLKNAADSAESRYRGITPSGPEPDPVAFSVCRGDTIDITPSPGSDFRFYSSYPDSLIGTGSSLRLKNISSEDTLYITNADSVYQSDTSAVFINIKDPVISAFTLTPDTLDPSVSNTVEFSSLSENYTSLTWHFGDGTTGTGENVSHQYYSNGAYEIMLQASGSEGCTATHTDTLIVETKLGNTKDSEAAIRLYPNPAESVLFITAENLKVYSVKVMNITGTVLKEQKITNKSSKVSIADLPPGMYTVFIETENGSFSEKIIKR